jgi:hypothetical protein
MKTNWLSAALILGAAGSDGAGALASEVAGPLAGVKVSHFHLCSPPGHNHFPIFHLSPLAVFSLPSPFTPNPFTSFLRLVRTSKSKTIPSRQYLIITLFRYV